jgi:hypothetical protein
LEEKRTRAPKRSDTPDKTPLTQYRLYFLRDNGDHISRSHEFEAENDESAIRISEGWREGRRAELWAGARKIKAWEKDR